MKIASILRPFIDALFKPRASLKVIKEVYKLGRILKLDPFRIAIHLTELMVDHKFWSFIRSEELKAHKLFSNPKLGGWMMGFPANFLYALIRVSKPKVVVETGVGPGGSTALILRALEKNKKGHLFSIDLPGNDAKVYPLIGRSYNIHLPPGYEVGWLVPPNLKPRWTLIIGDAKEQLPLLVRALEKIDVFLHDSLHTEEHILFELSTVSPLMGTGGLLLADDVNKSWSTSFVDFCQRRGLPYCVLSNRLGVSRQS